MEKIIACIFLFWSPLSYMLERIKVPGTQQVLMGILLISLFWWPLLAGDGFLYFADTVVEHFALQSFLKDSWFSGFDIAWNPYIGLGAPSLAEGHIGAFSPGNWIHFLFNSLPRSLSLVFLFHLLVGWVGTCLVARKLDISFEGQILSSVVFILGGYVTSFSTNHVYILAVCQIPWVLYLSFCFGEKPNYFTATILSVLMSLHFFTGAYPIFFITSISVLIVSVSTAIYFNHSIRKYSFFFSFATIGAILLSSIQLLPSIELILQSSFIKGRGVDYLTLNSLDGKLLLSLFFPHIWGFIESGDTFPILQSGEFLKQGYFDYDELHNYLGLFSLYLFMIGLVFYLNKVWHTKIRPFLILGVIAFCLAMGGSIFGIYHVLQYIPVFNFFKDPAKWSIVLNFSAAILIGFFWDTLKTDSKKKYKILFLAILVIFVVFYFNIFSDSYPQLFMVHRYPMCSSNFSNLGCSILQNISPIKFFSIFSILSILLILMNNRISFLLPLCLVFFDLWVVERTVFPLVQAEFFEKKPDQLSKLQEDFDFRVMNGFVDEYKTMNPAFLNGDMAAHWKIMGTTVTTPFVMSSYERLVQAANENGFFEILNRTQKTTFSENFLDAIGVKYLLEVSPEDSGASKVIERPRPRKIFYLTQDIQEISKSEDAREIFINRCHSQPYCGPSVIHESSSIIPRKNSIGSITRVFKTNTELVLKTKADERALLVWTDMNYPGWKVSVDGIDSTITVVNGMFKGVILPEGNHTVHFSFKSRSILWGKLISFFAWLMLLIGAAKHWKKSRSQFDKDR